MVYGMEWNVERDGRADLVYWWMRGMAGQERGREGAGEGA